MNRRRILLLVGLMLVGALFLAAQTQAQAPAQKPVEFTFAWIDWKDSTPQNMIYAPGREFERMLYQQSNGRLKLKIVPGMFPGGQVLAAVADGRANMGNEAMNYLSSTFPLLNWEEVPGLVHDTDYNQALAEEQYIWFDPKVNAILERNYRKAGVVPLFHVQWPFSTAVFTKKDMKTIDDFKGLKTRISGYVPGMTAKALGIIPVQVPYAETSSALMTGVVDAVVTSATFGVETMGLTFAKYVYLLPWPSVYMEVCLINKDKYDSLPPDLQKVLRDVSHEMAMMTQLSCQAVNLKTKRIVESYGPELRTLSDAEAAKVRERIKPVEGEWLKIAGPDGPELLAAAKDTVARFRAFGKYPVK